MMQYKWETVEEIDPEWINKSVAFSVNVNKCEMCHLSDGRTNKTWQENFRVCLSNYAHCDFCQLTSDRDIADTLLFLSPATCQTYSQATPHVSLSVAFSYVFFSLTTSSFYSLLLRFFFHCFTFLVRIFLISTYFVIVRPPCFLYVRSNYFDNHPLH